MISTDIEYYRQRAAKARKLAEYAIDSGTKLVHTKMAEEYEARVTELEASGFRRGDLSPA